MYTTDMFWEKLSVGEMYVFQFRLCPQSSVSRLQGHD